jgi:hypothetical protein
VARGRGHQELGPGNEDPFEPPGVTAGHTDGKACNLRNQQEPMGAFPHHRGDETGEGNVEMRRARFLHCATPKRAYKRMCNNLEVSS